MNELEPILGVPPEALPGVLPGFVATFVADAAVAATVRAELTAAMFGWPAERHAVLLAHLSTVGTPDRLWSAEPSAREVARLVAPHILGTMPIEGLHHLQSAMAAGPTLVACNHTAYFDSNAIDALLAREGATDLASALVHVAGPKVYQSLFRRLAASSMNTLPTPQSRSVASEGAVISRREVARQARHALGLAQATLDAGQPLVVFPEGSRTRTGRLRPFIKGAARWLQLPGVVTVPAALIGTDTIQPIGDDRLHPGAAKLVFGPPVVVDPNHNPFDALRPVHEAVAALLPPERQPLPGDPAVA